MARIKNLAYGIAMDKNLITEVPCNRIKIKIFRDKFLESFLATHGGDSLTLAPKAWVYRVSIAASHGSKNETYATHRGRRTL